jgi:hypothetical protein
VAADGRCRRPLALTAEVKARSVPSSRGRRYCRGEREMRGAPATFSGATLLVSE